MAPLRARQAIGADKPSDSLLDKCFTVILSYRIEFLVRTVSGTDVAYNFSDVQVWTCGNVPHSRTPEAKVGEMGAAGNAYGFGYCRPKLGSWRSRKLELLKSGGSKYKSSTARVWKAQHEKNESKETATDIQTAMTGKVEPVPW